MSEGLEARLGDALKKMQKGQLDAAASSLESLIGDGLDSVDALQILASIRTRQERHSAAVKWLRRILEQRPADVAIAQELLRETLKAEDYSGGLRLAERLTQEPSADAESWQLLASARRSLGRLEGAKDALRRAMEIDPKNSRVHHQYGLLWTQLEQIDAAIEAFRFATKLDPSDAMAWAHLGNALTLRNDQIVGMGFIRKALELAPRSSPVRVRAAMTFLQRGNLDLAERCLAEVFRRHPTHEEALSCLANVQERRGEYAKAVHTLKPALHGEMTRSNVAASYSRSCLRSGQAAEGLTLLDQALRISRPDGAVRLLEHIRGDCLAKLGRHRQALEAYTHGNQLATGTYEPARHRQFVETLIEAFPAESFERRPRATRRAEETVLIVGMPRSGSSLVEQILSSHSRVVGLGELPELRLVSLLLEKMTETRPWHQALDRLDAGQAQGLGKWYTDRVLQRARGQGESAPENLKRIDKMPSNFVFLGLAAHLLPGLRIVHTRRHPLDTCLSCFSQVFVGQGLGYSTRLDWLGQYYRDHERLMRHWQTVLPEPIFELQYEDLVTDPEPVVRGLLEHCGLDWEPGVLDFHQSGRNINTASYHQVRKPLYTSSVKKYEPYLPWLGELVEALDLEG